MLAEYLSSMVSENVLRDMVGENGKNKWKCEELSVILYVLSCKELSVVTIHCTDQEWPILHL